MTCPHRSARRLLAAAAAAASLLLAGCQLQLADGSASSPASVAHAAAHHSRHQHASSAGAAQLVTEPGAGFGRIYQLIGTARDSIDLTMYELADSTAERDLAAAAHRGVAVRVILDERERSENAAAYRYLTARHVHVVWSSSRFEYTHQKTLVIDHSAAVIMTANLTSRYYTTSRDFLVVDTDAADIAAIRRVFAADDAHRAITPGDGRDLVWSPANAEHALLGLINDAHASLRIYSEEMSDTTIIAALIRAARRGVDVQLCAENSDGEYDSAFARLARAGVHISYYRSATGFYIHGKVIEADYGRADARVFIGSENFSVTSLTRNRELGIILAQRQILAAIARSFRHDFQAGTHWR